MAINPIVLIYIKIFFVYFTTNNIHFPFIVYDSPIFDRENKTDFICTATNESRYSPLCECPVAI